MLDPSEMLAVARLLLTAGSESTPSDAQLRRAVSTAYYAVFHAVLRSGADSLIGPARRGSAAYFLLYRGFQHGRVKSVCKDLTASTLSPSLQRQLGRPRVSQDTKDFAGAFRDLQLLRHAADYDASSNFELTDASGMIDSAQAAMQAFDRIAPDEKTDILALMLVNPRE